MNLKHLKGCLVLQNLSSERACLQSFTCQGQAFPIFLPETPHPQHTSLAGRLESSLVSVSRGSYAAAYHWPGLNNHPRQFCQIIDLPAPITWNQGAGQERAACSYNDNDREFLATCQHKNLHKIEQLRDSFFKDFASVGPNPVRPWMTTCDALFLNLRIHQNQPGDDGYAHVLQV